MRQAAITIAILNYFPSLQVFFGGKNFLARAPGEMFNLVGNVDTPKVLPKLPHIAIIRGRGSTIPWSWFHSQPICTPDIGNLIEQSLKIYI